MVDLTISVNGRETTDQVFNLCSGTTATLSVQADPGAIIWSTGSTQPEITVQTAGTYKVTSGEGTGCENSNELRVEEVPLPEVTAGADQQVIQPGQSTRLHADGAQTYTWEPAESLDNPTSADPLASPVNDTDYTVTGIDNNGCPGTASVTIQVEEIPLLHVRAAPVFTPNGDMINDLWVIQNIDEFRNCAIKIFNRQGLTMYEASTYDNDWDGTYKGAEAPEGAYYYVLSCDNGQQYTGHFTLLR
jgi:gliding motility-associated-like protein